VNKNAIDEENWDELNAYVPFVDYHAGNYRNADYPELSVQELELINIRS